MLLGRQTIEHVAVNHFGNFLNGFHGLPMAVKKINGGGKAERSRASSGGLARYITGATRHENAARISDGVLGRAVKPPNYFAALLVTVSDTTASRVGSGFLPTAL